MRCSTLLCALLALPSGLMADALSRFFPAQADPVPALWWAIDSHEPLPIATINQWFIDTAPGLPAASIRPLPAEGVSIGLLAAVPDAQGQIAAREVMPPWPLNTPRLWPSEIRHRRVFITQAERSTTSLRLTLPLPGERISQLDAHLLLPRIGPPSGPYPVELAMPDAPPLSLQAIDQGESIRISFGHSWPISAALTATLTMPAEIALAPLSRATPVQWQVSWQSPSATVSGRQQWSRVLNSLLLHTGAHTENIASLAETLRAYSRGQFIAPRETSLSYRPPAVAEACGGHDGLLLAATNLQANISAQLSDRVERQLSNPLQPYRIVPRLFMGRLSGVDMHFAEPALGRAHWAGDHGFRVCRLFDDCADVSLIPPSLQAQQGIVLSDEVLGPHGQLTETQLAVALPLGLGDSVIIDSGADASRASGRAEYLLWLAENGSFLLRDGNTGALLWQWQPSLWQAYREQLALPAPAAIPVQIKPHALQLWSGEQGERIVYALLAGQLLALDLTQPLTPKRISFALSDYQVDSFVVMPKASTTAPGLEAPVLLLGVRPLLDSATHLLRINGRTGAISGHVMAKDELPRWSLPWVFIDWRGLRRGYASDSLGRVWRLDAVDGPGPLGTPKLIAQVAAAEAEPDLLSLPSLAIQSDDQGRQRVALALAARGHAEQRVSIFAWLDDERSLPLILTSLPAWTSATTAPNHAMGWQRQFSINQDLGLSPRWLDNRVLLTLESLHAPPSPCLAAEVRTQLYDLPWRAGNAREVDLGTSVAQLATPVLSTDGQLLWLGQSQPEAGVSVNAYRRRLQKAPSLE